MKMYIKNKKLASSNGILPKSLFLIVALLGTVIIWVLKSNGVNTLITVLIPVSLILLYSGLAWLTRMFYIREDQIGDNAYYLGFLFTLSSLAYALWKFQVDDGGDPADIIGSFGVALWSTIAGIALRVFFSQMQYDPNDIEKEARHRVAETASVLSSTLNQATVSFNDYIRGLQQSVDEANSKARELTENSLAAFEQLNDRINSIEPPQNVVNRKVEEMFGGLETATKKLTALADQQIASTDTLSNFSDKLLESIKSLNEEMQEMEKMASVAASERKELSDINTITLNLKDNLLEFSNSIDVVKASQEKSAKAITKHANELEKQLDRSRQYTEDTHDALLSMTKTLTEKI